MGPTHGAWKAIFFLFSRLNGHSSIVSLLLEYGADANAKNEDNTTALDLSCRKGFFEISKNLITLLGPEA